MDTHNRESKFNWLFIVIPVSILLVLLIIVISSKNRNETKNNSQAGSGTELTTPASWADTPIPDNIGDHWKKISLGASPITQDGITFSDTITDLGQFIPNTNKLWGFGYPNGKSTTGDFIQVDLTMDNTTQYTSVIEIVLYYLADQAGRGYNFTETNVDECSGSEGFISIPQTLKPGIPCTAHILYEVSKDSNSFNLDFDMKNDQYNNNIPFGKT